MIKELENKSEFEIYNWCTSEYKNDKNLHELRDFVKKNNYGFCDDEHHVMWREIVKSLPNNFSFLEIGVYKGQILCLVPKLAKHFNKTCNFLGVTPLNTTGDKYSIYNNDNYSENIINIFKTFNIFFDINKNILTGLSTDEKIKEELKKNKFDVVYIDGGHDYETVVSDIMLTKEILNENGLIVTDDSSCYKNFFGLPIFTGHIDVCNAIKEHLESDKNYVEIICVGHNRVFKKIK